MNIYLKKLLEKFIESGQVRLGFMNSDEIIKYLENKISEFLKTNEELLNVGWGSIGGYSIDTWAKIEKFLVDHNEITYQKPDDIHGIKIQRKKPLK